MTEPCRDEIKGGTGALPVRRALPTLESPPVFANRPAWPGGQIQLEPRSDAAEIARLADIPVGPATPSGAPPPRGAVGTRRRLHSVAGSGPAGSKRPSSPRLRRPAHSRPAHALSLQVVCVGIAVHRHASVSIAFSAHLSLAPSSGKAA